MDTLIINTPNWTDFFGVLWMLIGCSITGTVAVVEYLNGLGDQKNFTGFKNKSLAASFLASILFAANFSLALSITSSAEYSVSAFFLITLSTLGINILPFFVRTCYRHFTFFRNCFFMLTTISIAFALLHEWFSQADAWKIFLLIFIYLMIIMLLVLNTFALFFSTKEWGKEVGPFILQIDKIWENTLRIIATTKKHASLLKEKS